MCGSGNPHYSRSGDRRYLSISIAPHYNRRMPVLGDPRRRSMFLLLGGVLLLFAFLGALQAFNMSEFRFLDPETSGETLAFVGVIVLVFLVLMLLLTLLFRNILKLYADQSGSALGARLRTRMVVGAALIALIPAVCMFLFSFLLLNRSLDRWFSQPTSELREDSTRVILELAQYATANARVEAESIAASDAADEPTADLDAELHSHRITLDGGFAVVFDKDRRMLAGFQEPPESSAASLETWLDDVEPGGILLQGTLSQILLTSAQRGDETLLRVAGREFALGMAATASGKAVVVALPLPQGLSQTAAQIRVERGRIQATVSLTRPHSQYVQPDAAADYGLRVLLERVAGAVSFQANYAARGSAGRCHGRDCGGQVRATRAGAGHR